MNNSKRELMLCALLAKPTIREASETSGVPERTLYTWLRRSDFKAEYDRRRGQLIQSAWSALHGKLSDAVDVVAELMEDPGAPPQVRLSAARAVIEYSLKSTDQLDILRRLEILEAADSGTEQQGKGNVYCLHGSSGYRS
jgi:hypothetical protein